tara:strand:+ start:401 stop:892 length:492 start_codon:yes stop_codon:yes gene_type:complete
MPISKPERIVRKLGHTKQERLQIQNGTPAISDMEEGVPVLSYVAKTGLTEFVRHKNVLHKKVLDKADDIVGSTSESFADDGYVKLDNGLIMQWGQEDADASTETVTFPIPFPTACLNVTATSYVVDTGGQTHSPGINTLPTTTQVILNTKSSWGTIFWQAIGH